MVGLHPPAMFEYLLSDIFRILQSNLSASEHWEIWISAEFWTLKTSGLLSLPAIRKYPKFIQFSCQYMKFTIISYTKTISQKQKPSVMVEGAGRDLVT